MGIISNIRSELLSNQDGVFHFVTHNYDEVLKKEFNLSVTVEGKKDLGIENRKILANELSVSKEKLIFPYQCHTNHIKILDGNNSCDLSETDGSITNKKGVCLAVLSADCVPILMYDPLKSVIAAVHAGWRGTVQKIGAKAVNKMIDTYNCNPSDILVYIGPSICKQCYEVDQKVKNQFDQIQKTHQSIWSNSRKGHYFLNLWKANSIQLKELQVPEKNIEISGVCTFENTHRLFSARKNGFETGRFAVGIMLI